MDFVSTLFQCYPSLYNGVSLCILFVNCRFPLLPVLNLILFASPKEKPKTISKPSSTNFALSSNDESRDLFWDNVYLPLKKEDSKEKKKLGIIAYYMKKDIWGRQEVHLEFVTQEGWHKKRRIATLISIL